VVFVFFCCQWVVVGECVDFVVVYFIFFLFFFFVCFLFLSVLLVEGWDQPLTVGGFVGGIWFTLSSEGGSRGLGGCCVCGSCVGYTVEGGVGVGYCRGGAFVELLS